MKASEKCPIGTRVRWETYMGTWAWGNVVGTTQYDFDCLLIQVIGEKVPTPATMHIGLLKIVPKEEIPLWEMRIES